MKTERESSALRAHAADRGVLARLRSPRPGGSPAAGQGSAPASAAPAAGQRTAPAATAEAPPARLMAQLRQLARSRGLPDDLADRLAGRPGMSLRRAEALAPGLEVIRDLSQRQRLGAEDLDRAVRDYVAQLEQAGDAEGGDGGEPDAARVQEVARDVIFAAAADADVRDIGPTREVSVGVDWDRGPGLRARLVDGLQARLDRSHEPTLGREFAQSSLSELCMSIARGRGERVSGRREAVRMVTGGAHTSSDFALITADAMSNVVGRQFAQRQPDLARASREIPRDSYHEGHSLTLSASGMPQEVLEGGEINFTSMQEGGEALPAPRDFAAGFNLTNRAIVNDRVDLLSQAGERMVRGAVERLRRVLLEPLEANGGAGQTMRDGNPVFDAARGNVAGTGGALSLETLAAARVALRKATGLKGELFAVEPWALVVPAELETSAQQLVADLAATKYTDANPFAGALEIIVEPGLADPVAWYLIGNPAVHDGLAHAFLDGQSAPRVESRPAWETLGVQYRLTWAIDAKFVETASWFRNPGA